MLGFQPLSWPLELLQRRWQFCIMPCYNHCVKSVLIVQSYSGQHFPRIFLHSDWIRRDTPYLFLFFITNNTIQLALKQKSEKLSLFTPYLFAASLCAAVSTLQYIHYHYKIYYFFDRRRASLRIQSVNAGKCGKKEDQNNSEYEHLLRSEYYKSRWFVEKLQHLAPILKSKAVVLVVY